MSNVALVPVAPYRALEAIWYADSQPELNENYFQYPYMEKMPVQVDENLSIIKRLKHLSGTELLFEVESVNGLTGTIHVKASPVKKNVSEIRWEIPPHQFNGKTESIGRWLHSTVNHVQSKLSS